MSSSRVTVQVRQAFRGAGAQEALDLTEQTVREGLAPTVLSADHSLDPLAKWKTKEAQDRGA